MKTQQQQLIDKFLDVYTSKLKENRDWFMNKTVHNLPSDCKGSLTFYDLIEMKTTQH